MTQAPYTFYAEMTPNPNTMKYVANRWIITTGKSYEFLATERIGSPSPLAEQLFNFPFVNGVFISGNYVTITKSDAVEWTEMVMELRDFIRDFMNKEGAEPIKKEYLESETEQDKTTCVTAEKLKIGGYSEIETKIIEILDEYIKPAVENDGGAIEFDSYEAGTVKVILKGSCSGCPSSTITLKHGIETMLKNMLPEIREVVAING